MDPADPERPPTAEGGASGAEKGKKRDEIASISSNEPSGGTQVETDGLKGGGVELDNGDGGDASPNEDSITLNEGGTRERRCCCIGCTW